jgi:hypothetical protein
MVTPAMVQAELYTRMGGWKEARDAVLEEEWFEVFRVGR